MIFNSPTATILFAILCATVTMAEIKVKKHCLMSDESYSKYSFYLAADQITAKAGSMDIDETLELTVLTADCNHALENSTADDGPYEAYVYFNTSTKGVQAELEVIFIRYVNGWNVTGVSVMFYGSDGSYGKALSEKEVKELGWHSSAGPKKWYKCSSVPIRFGKQNTVELENMRLFPVMERWQPEPTKDEDFELCKKSDSDPGLAWWAIISIVIGAVAIVSGLSYGGYRLYQAKKSH